MQEEKKNSSNTIKFGTYEKQVLCSRHFKNNQNYLSEEEKHKDKRNGNVTRKKTRIDHSIVHIHKRKNNIQINT
jgi:hypothetical protein